MDITCFYVHRILTCDFKCSFDSLNFVFDFHEEILQLCVFARTNVMVFYDFWQWFSRARSAGGGTRDAWAALAQALEG
jgi:hypothetical protein